MKKGKDEHKRRSDPRFRSRVIGWLQKCADNTRTELTKLQIENFLDALPSWTDYQIDTAFKRAIGECFFFPTVKDIINRMPEDRHSRDPITTCALCEPDGYRLIDSPNGRPYRCVVRCDHDPKSHVPALGLDTPEYAEATRKLYERVRYTAAPGLAVRKTSVVPPRWPHLIGKGIAPQKPLQKAKLTPADIGVDESWIDDPDPQK